MTEPKKLAPHHAGRKKMYLLKVRDLQRLYQKHKIHEGILDRWIYENHVGPTFHLGYGTMKGMLEINVRQEWKRAGLGEAEFEAA